MYVVFDCLAGREVYKSESLEECQDYRYNIETVDEECELIIIREE